MKAFLTSRFVRTLATLVMLARAIVRPLSRSIVHSHAAPSSSQASCSIVTSPNMGTSNNGLFSVATISALLSRRLVSCSVVVAVLCSLLLMNPAVGHSAHAQSQLLPYPTAVLADSPVLYYRLGDPSGSTVAVDSSGNGHNGVYAGGVTLGEPGALAGDPDTSAAFDGSTGIVDSGTNVISTSSTIEAWIRPTRAQGCFGTGCSLGEEVIAGTGGSFQLTFGRVPGTARVWLWPSDNTDWHFLDASTSVPLNTWSYIATTWDDTTKILSIYINGTLNASLSLPGVTSSFQSFNPLPFTFNLAGFEPAPQQQYQGGLDEVAYYNHALSADRILAHYTAATVLQVPIDIKPGEDPASINPNSVGVTPVAILSTPTFDATTVAPQSVKFGPNGASPVNFSIQDVDGDGTPDLVLQFTTTQTGIVAGNTQACLTGQTTGGVSIMGCDTIQTVPSSP